MRYPATAKLEIIRIVEQSHLPAKQTLDRLGIARRTFYRWYDHYLEGGPEALADKPSAPSRVWNRIPAEVQDQIIDPSTSLRRRWSSPSYPHANWRCASPTSSATSCPTRRAAKPTHGLPPAQGP